MTQNFEHYHQHDMKNRFSLILIISIVLIAASWGLRYAWSEYFPRYWHGNASFTEIAFIAAAELLVIVVLFLIARWYL